MLSWYYLKSFCMSPVACVSYFSKHGSQSLPCSPRTISRKQEDTDGQGTVSSLILCEISIEDHCSQEWKTRSFFSYAHQGEKENSTWITQRTCSPFPFLLITWAVTASYLRCVVRGLPPSQVNEAMMPRAEVRSPWLLTVAAGWETAEFQEWSLVRQSLMNSSFSLPKVQYSLSISTSNSISSEAW